MLFRIFLSIIIFFSIYNNLLSMGKGDKTALSNIKKVELIDKAYRTVAVLPFENLTRDDHYSYIGKTIQRFLSDNLSVMDKINVSTNDFFIKKELRTNNIVFSYGSNLSRKVIILNPDTIYKQYIKFYDPGDLKEFSREIKADYIISGQYDLKRSKINTQNFFDISFGIYNVIGRKQAYRNSCVLDHKKIDIGIEKMGIDIMQYFYPRGTGSLKIVTDLSDFQIYINNQLIQKEEGIYKLPTGRHKIKFLTPGYHPIVTNVILNPGRTNIFSLFKKDLFKDRAMLVVNSDPADADVYLNVKHLGHTPLSRTNLLPGKYRLKVIKSNYSAVFKNINLKNETNRFNIELEKVHSGEYYLKKHKKNKLIMYISLGAGALFMLNTYYFYSKAQDEEDRLGSTYDYSTRKKISKDYDKYSLIYQISGIAGIGSLAVSLIYFIKVINYDDVNIGTGHRDINTDYAFKNNKHYFTLNYKW